MTDYPDWQRNGADSYALAVKKLREEGGWRCPAYPPARCKDHDCMTGNFTGQCKHNGQSILPRPVHVGGQ
ncbi:MAG: hypothetical protein VX464_20775 [Pseudomonadota bacterium]|nr:hypothetical protein [Pseudomonadota bacterium]